MWSSINMSVLRQKALRTAVLFGILALAGCGYGLGTEGPSVLDTPAEGGLPTLKFKSVENPTLYPWLSYVIRTELRDEIAARDIARWVDSGKADYELAITVENFVIRSWLTDTDNATTLYSASITLRGTVYRGDSNEEVWRSGTLQYSQSYDSIQERTVAADLTRELAHRFASAMRQNF